jgi:hypothetical protein
VPDFLQIMSELSFSRALNLIRPDIVTPILVPQSLNTGALRLPAATGSGASAAGHTFGDVQFQIGPGVSGAGRSGAAL